MSEDTKEKADPEAEAPAAAAAPEKAAEPAEHVVSVGAAGPSADRSRPMRRPPGSCPVPVAARSTANRT